MRNLLLASLALGALACGDKHTAKEVTARHGFAGTWTSIVDTLEMQEPGYRDTLRFGSDSSFSIRIYNAQGLVQETQGTYHYDTARKALVTMAPTGNKAFFVPGRIGDTLFLNDGEGSTMKIRRIGD